MLLSYIFFSGDSSEDCKEKAETEAQEKLVATKNKSDNNDDVAKSSSTALTDEELLLHDVGFTIAIKPPTGEAFDIQVLTVQFSTILFCHLTREFFNNTIIHFIET